MVGVDVPDVEFVLVVDCFVVFETGHVFEVVEDFVCGVSVDGDDDVCAVDFGVLEYGNVEDAGLCCVEDGCCDVCHWRGFLWVGHDLFGGRVYVLLVRCCT